MIQTSEGKVSISNQVITKIAEKALRDIEGIRVVTGGLNDILSQLSSSRQSKGITIHRLDAVTNVELRIIVDYGVKIHHVCRELQQRVKNLIENITGSSIGEIFVKVEGIALD